MSERRDALVLFDEQRKGTEARIAEGIETHRKGDFSVTVTTADGRTAVILD